MMTVVANILDPAHDVLDPTVWEAVNEYTPVLKRQHKDWILTTILDTLKNHGYGDMDKWLEVYLTGSLTTYQYSPESDCDCSLFVNTDAFPEWSRAEMIGLMVSEVDGTTLPGTTHPMQCYVVAKGIRPQDLYQPGLRSGYGIQQDRWVVPPEKDRIHDVAKDQQADYHYALEQADKMDRLLRYEPDKAVQFWHQIHVRRMRDQRMGKGDFAQSNIIYKFLSNRGLFPRLEEATGEHIAKTAGLMPHPDQVEIARQRLNLEHPVRFMPTYKPGLRGGYAGISRDPQTGQDSHLIYFNPEQHPGARNWAAWHELGHAWQHEQGQPFEPNHAWSDDVYYASPKEAEAEALAAQHADHELWKTAADKPRALLNDFRPEKRHPKGPNGDELPFIYDPADNIVHVGPANSLHWELIARTPELRAQYPMDRAYGSAPFMTAPNHLHGRVEWPGKITHFMGLNDDNAHYRDAVNLALGATSAQSDDWGQMFGSTSTKGLYVGQAEANDTIQPPSEEAWSIC